MPADFSLLQTPNFAQAALSGYQAGSALGRQKQTQAAMAGIDLERPETIMALMKSDPGTAIPLLGASMKMADYKHELASKAATSDYLISRLGLDKPSAPAGVLGAPPATPAAVPPTLSDGTQAVNSAANSTFGAPAAVPPAPAAPATPQPDQSDIVVTAPRDPQAARVAMIRSDPEAYIKMETSISGMTEAQHKAATETTSAFDAALQGVKTIPYGADGAQRRAYIASHRNMLIQSGVPAQQIDGFDPTDANVTAQDNQVLGIKGILEQKDKDRSFGLQQDQFGETVHQHGVENGLSAKRVGLEAQNVGIAGGHLALDRQKEVREAKKQTGGVSAMTTDDLVALARGKR